MRPRKKEKRVSYLSRFFPLFGIFAVPKGRHHPPQPAAVLGVGARKEGREWGSRFLLIRKQSSVLSLIFIIRCVFVSMLSV